MTIIILLIFHGKSVVGLGNKKKLNRFQREGQIQNKGNVTAKSVIVTLTVFDKDSGIIGTQFTYPYVRTLKPDHKSTFMMTSSIDNFKGMKYYEISLEWKKPDGSKTYVENAKIYKQNKTLPVIPNK